MEDGIYSRRKFEIKLYEKEGSTPFVVVNNDMCADRPIVLKGENAQRMILAFADCLAIIEGVKGS